MGHFAPLGDIPGDTLYGHIPFEGPGRQIGQHGFRHFPHGPHPILAVALGGLGSGLGGGGSGPDDGLQKGTPMIHDGISVAQFLSGMMCAGSTRYRRPCMLTRVEEDRRVL
jgi:hypothetical protein